MPSWNVHVRWYVKLGCDLRECGDVDFIVDRFFVHDFGRRRFGDVDVSIRRVMYDATLSTHRKFLRVGRLVCRKADLVMVNYRLRIREGLRKAFYMHHVLDTLLNTLIPANNVYGGLRSVRELVDLALHYLDKIYESIPLLIPEPNDGFLKDYDRVREEIRRVLLQHTEQLVSGDVESKWIKRVEESIRKKISEACKSEVYAKFRKITETMEKARYVHRTYRNIVEGVAHGRTIGVLKRRVVDSIMLCSGIYYYTLLNPWKAGNPLYILQEARKTLKRTLEDLMVCEISISDATNYMFHEFPFSKYPYPKETLSKVENILAHIFPRKA